MTQPKPLVVVSHAHVGGTGAVSSDGAIQEEVYSARVCNELAQVLRDLGCNVYEVAQPNQRVVKSGVRQLAKVETINKLNAVMAIEPHNNALRRADAEDEDDDGDRQELVDDPRGNGFMVLHDATSHRSEALAQSLATTLEQALPMWTGKKGDPFRNRGAEPAPGPMVFRKRVAFLNDTRCVAALPELLFLTNRAEVEFLLRPTTPRLLAEALASGVAAWLRSEKLL
jgi:N-acetylmuramoyl-L-alanine amidase